MPFLFPHGGQWIHIQRTPRRQIAGHGRHAGNKIAIAPNVAGSAGLTWNSSVERRRVSAAIAQEADPL